MNEPAFSLSAFRMGLAETVVWCARHAVLEEPAKSLRTASCAPHPFGRKFEDVVESALTRRRSALTRAGLTSGTANGRLLAYDPDSNLSDGAARQESRGFFDDDNTPPWDTWLGYVTEDDGAGSGRFVQFTGYLISWVPQEFVALAEAGIDANPERCILWLADVPYLRERPSPIAKSILESGLPGTQLH